MPGPLSNVPSCSSSQRLLPCLPWNKVCSCLRCATLQHLEQVNRSLDDGNRAVVTLFVPQNKVHLIVQYQNASLDRKAPALITIIFSFDACMAE